MTESYWDGSQWCHFCKHANFELRLGPSRQDCIYKHTGCDAVIPMAGVTKKEIPKSSWNLKPTKQETL